MESPVITSKKSLQRWSVRFGLIAAVCTIPFMCLVFTDFVPDSLTKSSPNYIEYVFGIVTYLAWICPILGVIIGIITKDKLGLGINLGIILLWCVAIYIISSAS